MVLPSLFCRLLIATIPAQVGIVPVLRGGLGMVEAMTEMVSNAQVRSQSRLCG